ncbi:MAG: AMP-binding protein [Gammaproteobacteria bacterium]|nr:AMP-binding protein [Gammaproteobacteria bacterium]
MNRLSLLNLSLPDGKKNNFDTLCENFQWDIPDELNIAELVCSRHAKGANQLALIAESESGPAQRYSFDEIDQLSNQLANAFKQLGITRGDRVAVVLPQRLETALVHLAAQKLGAVSLPLSVLFGDEALQFRLADSQSRLVVTNKQRASLLESIRADLPALEHIVCVGNEAPAELASPPIDDSLADCFWRHLTQASSSPVQVTTYKDDPAFLLYTSGTTGPPKGALVPQRALIGNLTGFELSHNGFPQTNDCVFTPADWAWTGGLLDALLPAWYYGVPVVGYDAKKFDAAKVASLMSRHKVTCAFIPPTALKMMRAVPDLFVDYPSSIRSIMSAGEAVGEELLYWGRQALNIDINEMCGQTEHNYLMGNCSAIMEVRAGSMGKAYPGHRVAIMGADGQLLPAGEQGEIVAHCDDPVHFLGYFNNPEATAAKYSGQWFHTGDVGYADDAGYLWFVGRADDVISSAGYRIGPGEIEDCVMQHPSVLQVAAIGVPDPQGLRGDVVKLCIVPRQGVVPDVSLSDAIRDQVRNKLAAYEYPRIIEFYDALPMTTTGKVKRRDLRAQHIDALDS